MKVLRLLKAFTLVAALAAVTCVAQSQPSPVSPSADKTVKGASIRNDIGPNSAPAKQATTPVTPAPKKDPAKTDATLDAKPESASAESAAANGTAGREAAPSAVPAMSESEALPQGTPFVPDLNLFGPSTTELRQRLATALRNDPALRGSNIEANVSDDTISLTGSVRSAKDRETARRIAASFAANRKVKERITVAGSAAGNSGQSASEINATPTQKNPSATPPTSTGQKPESPNRPVMDPVNAQEKPKAGG